MEKRWKQHLLKSGLPLEFVVARELESRGHDIFGEYPYLRPDERGEVKEFSVDVRTHYSSDIDESFHTLTLLVECKYRNPGTVWMFAPLISNAYAIGLVHDNEDLLPVRFHGEHFCEFESKVGYCIGGVEIGGDGGGNRDAVRHGIAQLRYAMPSLLDGDYRMSLEHIWDDGHHASFCCPILVTTAEIRCLRTGLSLDAFHSADSLDDVSELRGATIVNERPGPQLQEYADQIAGGLVRDFPKLERRLAGLGQLLVGPEYESRFAPDLADIRRSFGNSAERVLVVNSSAFPEVLSHLHSAFEGYLRSNKIYGSLARVAGDHSLIDLAGNAVANDI